MNQSTTMESTTMNDYDQSENKEEKGIIKHKTNNQTSKIIPDLTTGCDDPQQLRLKELSQHLAENIIPFISTTYLKQDEKEKIYEATVSHPSKCNSAEFIPIAIIPNRHIFSFKKGHWQ